MSNHRHPDPEQLDRLRCGLLDDQPATRLALEAHLRDCAGCRALANPWQRLAEGLDDGRETEALRQDLERARHRALAADQRRPAYVRYAGLAAAAALLVAVSLGLLTPPGQGTDPGRSSRTAQIIPDEYEDLDFYLWLADQGNNRNSTDPSNPDNT